MGYYLDIHLLPDPEFSPPVLLNALHAKLHRALVAQQRSDIGVSFPGFDASRPTLGLTLRLHGSSAAVLDSLMAARWLTGMHDHIELGKISPVPASAKAITVLRIQAKSNPAYERERLMRRKGLSEQEALARIPDSAAERLDLPFLTVRSQSTGQQFRLFIRQQAVETAISGQFNCYGLSDTATVADF